MRYEHLTILVLALLGFPLYGRAQDNKPTETTVCELRKNAGAWDQKSVLVKAYVTHGFEESSLVDPACGGFEDGSDIWMEYGGRVGSGTMYFGPVSPRNRTQDLVVQGVTTRLVEDSAFSSLDSILQSGAHSHGIVVFAATVQGRFFAGKEDKKSSTFRGFGHFGCCSLFVLEKVEEVAQQPLTEAEKEKFAEVFHMVPPPPPPPVHRRKKR